MDAALKQRLVGAAVLVALAVIFLPMLVDGPEPPPGTASVPLDIPPAPERDFETRDLPLAPSVSTPTPSAPTMSEPDADDPGRVVTVETIDTPRVDALPQDSPPPAAAPASSAPDSPVASAPTTVSVPAATPGGRFAVNLGSYGNVANANALVAALKAAGLTVLSDPVQLDGKPGVRVRLGPYAQRGEAEAARLAATRLRADLPASVVAFEAGSAEAATAPVRAAVGSGFAVQIGALRSEADANALRARARSVGLTAFVERVDAESGPLWRVRVGPELQRANAEKLKLTVMQKLQIDGMVVTHP